MMSKTMSLACVLFSTQVLAFPCFMTVVKDRCWGNYDLTVIIRDASTDSTLLTVVVPKGQFWTRAPFTCQGGQRLGYSASFEPNIWDSDKGVVYQGTKYTLLPLAPTALEKAWEIPICFPLAFPGTPYPPTAIGNCACDMKSIPPVPPMK